jgi:hypothetical protein
LVALCFAIGNLSAQAGWEKIFTSNSPDHDHDYSDMVISHDGHIVVNIFSPDGNLGTGEPRNILIKMDNNSNIIWSKLMPTTSRYEDMKLTSDGGFLFTGELDFKHYLAKVDASGNLLWYQSYDIDGYANKIVETAQHDILLGGTIMYSNGQVGITKTDPSGNIIWTQEYESLLHIINFSENPNGTIHLIVTGYHKILDDQGNVLVDNFLSLSTPDYHKAYFLDDGFISVRNSSMYKIDYEGNFL